MKQLSSLSLLGVISLSLSAQSSLSSSSNLPRQGDRIIKQQVVYKAPGQGGSEVVCSRPFGQYPNYTYSPLIGLTSVTAPTDETETYQYDSAGRLIRTIDYTGKIVSSRYFRYRP